MAGLTDTNISTSYTSLLRVDDNTTGVDGTLENITDGEGNATPLDISTTKFRVYPSGNAADTFNVTNSSNSSVFNVDTSNTRIGMGNAASPTVTLDIELASAAPQVRIGRADASTGNTLGELYFGNSADTLMAGMVGFEDGATSAAGLKFNVEAESSDIATAMTIKSDGKVGIGTVTPAVDLDIEDTSTSGSSAGGTLRLGSNDGAVMASGHRLGAIEFAGAEDTSSTMTVGAKIEAITDAIWSGTENGAALRFYTTDGNASINPQMTILATGEVGIGTLTPTTGAYHKLTLETTDSTTLRINSDSTSGAPKIILENNTREWHILNKGNSAEEFVIRDNTTSGGVDRLTILGSGFVGIGTGSPDYLLDVEAATSTGRINSTGNNNAGLILKNTACEWFNYIAPTTGNWKLKDNTGAGVTPITIEKDSADNMLYFKADGTVGIGTDAPSSTFEVESPNASHLQLSLYCTNSSAGDPLIRFGGANDTSASADADFDWGCGVDRSANTFEIRYASGGVTEMSSASWFSMTNTGVLTIDAGTVTSDERLKKDITDLSNPLATINSLKGKTFKWKDAMSSSGIQYGMIAQEVELVIPELVMESTCKQLNPDGTIFKGDNLEDTMTADEAVAARNLTNTKTVNMNGIIPILIEAVKELSAKVTALENA